MKKRGTTKSRATPKRLIFKLVANVFPGWRPEFAKENRRSSLIGFRLIDTTSKPRTHLIWFRKSRRYPLNKARLKNEVRQHELRGLVVALAAGNSPYRPPKSLARSRTGALPFAKAPSDMGGGSGNIGVLFF